MEQPAVVAPRTEHLAVLSDYPIAKAAEAYATWGFAVVPLHAPKGDGCTCDRAGCEAQGKHPRFREWQKNAIREPSVARKTFARTDLQLSNVGLLMGHARLVALDVDGELGRTSLAQLEAEHGALPVTLTSRSGRPDGGEHKIFCCPESLDISRIANRAGKRKDGGKGIAPGLDVRATGGQIVVAPSLHRSGARYAWSHVAPIAELPRWLFALMTGEAHRDAAQKTIQVAPLAGEAADRRATAWARAAVERELAAIRKERETPESPTNDQINASSFNVGQIVGAGLYDEHTARAELVAAGIATGHPADAVRKTVDSGLASGMKSPRAPKDRRPALTVVRDRDVKPSNGGTDNHDGGPWGDELGYAAEDIAPVPAAPRRPQFPKGVWFGSFAEIDALELPEPTTIGCLGSVPLVSGTAVLVHSAPSCTKTLLAFRAALQVVIDGHRALIVEGEGTEAATRSRLQRLAHGMLGAGLTDERASDLFITHGRFALDEEDGAWTDALAYVKPSLVVIDPLVTYSRANENDAKEVSEFLRIVDKAREHGATVLLLHHATKPDADGKTRERGSSALRAWADSVISLAKTDKPGHVLLAHEKMRDAKVEDPETLVWTFADDAIHLRTERAADDAVKTAMEATRHRKILGLLVDGPLTARELREKVGGSGVAMSSLLETLERQGRVARTAIVREDTIGRRRTDEGYMLGSGHRDTGTTGAVPVSKDSGTDTASRCLPGFEGADGLR